MINLSVIKNISRAKKYLKGNIFEKDNSELYIILKGEVGVFSNYQKPNEEMTGLAKSGDIFGETAFFPEKRTPYTCVALTDIYALPISKSSAEEFIKEEAALTLEIMKELYIRLSTIREEYEKLSGHPWIQYRLVPKKDHAAHTPKSENRQPVSAQTPDTANMDALPVNKFPLFPEGHGNYELTMNNRDRTYLLEKSYTCPLCKKTFNSLKIKASKLILDRTDSDMRSYYKDIEPIYYDVITCPHCLYSALSDMFESPEKNIALMQELKAFHSGIKIQTGSEMDTFSVFAGYYLALFCAPKCFSSHRLITAKLLLKLSRIYQDCQDKYMEEQTAKLALDAYLSVYMNEELAPGLDQQLCLIIGELYLKTNDIKNAKDFFLKAKLNREGTPFLKSQAENRIMDLRAMEGRSQKQ